MFNEHLSATELYLYQPLKLSHLHPMSRLLRACDCEPSRRDADKTAYFLRATGGVCDFGVDELICMPERGVWTGIAAPGPETRWPLKARLPTKDNFQMIRLHHQSSPVVV